MCSDLKDFYAEVTRSSSWWRGLELASNKFSSSFSRAQEIWLCSTWTLCWSPTLLNIANRGENVFLELQRYEVPVSVTELYTWSARTRKRIFRHFSENSLEYNGALLSHRRPVEEPFVKSPKITKIEITSVSDFSRTYGHLHNIPHWIFVDYKKFKKICRFRFRDF